MIRNESQINKTSDLPNGVSRFVEYDHRLTKPKPKVGFTVLVYVHGKKYIKKFRVSAKASEDKAKKAALRYRSEYERCTKYPMFPFNPHFLDNWNK